MNIPAPDETPDPGPDFDLRAYLRGSWSVDRTLLDRATGTSGTFTGVVRFTADDDGGLLWREEGTVRWATVGGTPFTAQASREYLLQPADTPDVLDVYFPDGRPFHRMGFAGQTNQDEHWCDPDTYRVTYRVLGPAQWGYQLGRHRARQGPVAGVHPAPAGSRTRSGTTGRTRRIDGCRAGHKACRVNPRIVVSAVCVFDRSGRLLTVRKRGTDKFMHPGGKPEPGETAAQAAARELQEEVGIVLAPDRLDLLGCWLADAANEAATQIEATVFTAPGVWSARPSAEIAEIRWLDLAAELPADLAPLLTDHVLPALSAKPPAG